MESSNSISWVWFLSRLGGYVRWLAFRVLARRGWYRFFREYDRNIPVIVGRFLLSDLDGTVRSNLDICDVIGFIVGYPSGRSAGDPLNCGLIQCNQ